MNYQSKIASGFMGADSSRDPSPTQAPDRLVGIAATLRAEGWDVDLSPDAGWLATTLSGSRPEVALIFGEAGAAEVRLRDSTSVDEDENAIQLGLALAHRLSAKHLAIQPRVQLVFFFPKSLVKSDTLFTEPNTPAALLIPILSERLPAGSLGLRSGAAAPSEDMFSIRIQGKGGHAAKPHLAIDPILAASHVVIALPSILSRNMDPFEPAELTVTDIAGGNSTNIIPEVALVHGKMRAVAPGARAMMHTRLSEIATGVAGGLGCKAEVMIEEVFPALNNDPDLVHRLESIFLEPDSPVELTSTIRQQQPSLLAPLSHQRPCCILWIGTAQPEGAKIDPVERLEPGISALERAIRLLAA